MQAEKATQRLSAEVSRQLLKGYKPSSKVLPKIAALIRKNSKFLLTTHIGADADGLGSQIGLYYLLKALKKDVRILNNEKVPEYLETIMPVKLVGFLGHNGIEEAAAAKLMKDRFVFILDSSEPHRSDKVGELFLALKRPWATIDHHILPGKRILCRPELCRYRRTHMGSLPPHESEDAESSGAAALHGHRRRFR